jgi:hypothetical protein
MDELPELITKTFNLPTSVDYVAKNYHSRLAIDCGFQIADCGFIKMNLSIFLFIFSGRIDG